MLDFFDSVVNFFELIWQFIENLISGITTLLEILVQAVLIPPFLSALVPPFLSACIISVAAIGVAKLIAGWGNK